MPGRTVNLLIIPTILGDDVTLRNYLERFHVEAAADN